MGKKHLQINNIMSELIYDLNQFQKENRSGLFMFTHIKKKMQEIEHFDKSPYYKIDWTR